jgi:apolipoprotein N-acyltransferase
VPPPAGVFPGDLLARRRAGGSLDSLRSDPHAWEGSLYGALRPEAAAGARLVFWSEAGLFVLKDDEAAFLARAAAFARVSGVVLIAGVAVFTPGEGYYENLLVAFDPSGAMVARYHKARPVPGDPERGADRTIPVFQTTLGKIAGAVCSDANFPDLIARAGRDGAGLLIIPASDWRAIDPVHTRMALVRGIENGCSVVRQTNKGLSAAADRQGRMLAASDYFRADPRTMVAQVPVHGVGTLYPHAPNALPYACIAALALIALRRFGSRGPPPEGASP